MNATQLDQTEESHAAAADLTSAQQTILILEDCRQQLAECAEILKRAEYNIAHSPILPIPLSTHVLPFCKRMAGLLPKKRKRADRLRAARAARAAKETAESAAPVLQT